MDTSGFRLSCAAPQLAMRFSPDGTVHTCCVNSTHPLGHVGTDRLLDVWRGPRRAALRRAVDAGDGSLGCRDCAYEHERGRRELTHAALYDEFSGAAPGEWPVRLEFAMSNVCNLMCVHCNGELSSSIRGRREHRDPLTDHYGDQFFDDIGPFLDHVEVTAFLGGEPFLSRHARRVWDMLIERGRDVRVHVTTNGTVWNEQVLRYLTELRMNVALSVDSIDRELFERIRQGASFDDVRAFRDRVFELTRSYGGSFVLNHCLMRQNVASLYDFLADAAARGMDVEVIPVVFPAQHSPLALGPDELERVVRHLRSRADRDGPPGRNAAVFEQAVAHLEGSARELTVAPDAELREIPVGMPQRRPVLLRESLASQREHGGADPLRVEVAAGIVTSVEVPAWADVLEPHSWVGRPDASLLEDICDRLSGRPSWEVRWRWEELTEVDLTLEGAEGSHVLRVHFVDWHEHDVAHRSYLIASSDLADARR